MSKISNLLKGSEMSKICIPKQKSLQSPIIINVKILFGKQSLKIHKETTNYI